MKNEFLKQISTYFPSVDYCSFRFVNKYTNIVSVTRNVLEPIEILEDETELLCVLQHSFGWAYKNVDLNPEEQIETEKNSDKCYLFFGNKCEVTSVNNMYPVTVEKYEVIELTNEKCVVRNISNKPCKVVMLCK